MDGSRLPFRYADFGIDEHYLQRKKTPRISRSSSRIVYEHGLNGGGWRRTSSANRPSSFDTQIICGRPLATRIHRT